MEPGRGPQGDPRTTLPTPGEVKATPRQPDCLESRWGRALEPGDAQAPFSLSFRTWREVDAYFVSPVPPGEAIQGADEDVADRHPDKEEPKPVEDGPHRREMYAVGAWIGAGTRVARTP
jgi:hypothetical protein